MYLTSSYPSFERARPGEYWLFINMWISLIFSLSLGIAYVLHTLCWIFSVLVTFGVLLTGISAGAGHRWAAGNRVYQPIP